MLGKAKEILCDLTKTETYEQAIAAAFKQIQEKAYVTELEARGIQTIKTLAVVCDGKDVWVREAKTC